MQKNLRSYSYSNRPRELSSINCNRIKQILKSGNANKLEKIIREGRGYHLIGEFSSDPKIRSLLKSVPFYMARIDMLHDAVTEGRLRDLQILLDTSSPEFSKLKPKAENLVTCKDNAGVGLLHKAVYYDHPHIIEWLIHHYPATTQLQDKMGRIPLHYVNSTANPEQTWQLLVEHGSPVDLKDAYGKTPHFYLNGDDAIHLPGKIWYNEFLDEGIVVKPSNLRIWIHDQDIARLREVVWQGYGDELRTQTSNKTMMKKFLTAVPYVMTVIREIHRAAIENCNNLATLCHPPVPAVILKSKDDNGLTALHKACGLGNKEVVAYILQTYPRAIHICDNGGRTPIHYAAIFAQQLIYKELLNAGANEHIIDKNGKTAQYYRNKIDDVCDVHIELLRRLPPGPQIGIELSVVDTTFDWSIFNGGSLSNSNLIPMLYVDLIAPTNEPSKMEAAANECAQLAVLAIGDNGEAKGSSRKQHLAAAFGQLRTVACALHLQPDTSDIKFQFTEQVPLVENETTNLSPWRNEERWDKLEGDSDTTALCADSESGAESAVAETAQLADSDEKWRTCSVADISLPKLSGEMELRVDNVLRNENVEEIGELLLAGYGERLLQVTSDNQIIQEFVRQLPIYLSKIKLIHQCCETGNVEELRKNLDRRKWAVAREGATELFLTPLHVAVTHNRMEVVRYLGGRFPETLYQPDILGRTPLHYAAIPANGKFVYHTLLTLGADKDFKDHNGHSAQFYYDNPKERYQEELTDIIQKLKLDSATWIVKTMSVIDDGQTWDEKSTIPEEVEECEDSGRIKEANESTEVTNAPETPFVEDKHKSEQLEQNLPDVTTPQEDNVLLNYDPSSNVFLALSRDEYGRTEIHQAASKKHSRNFLLQMLQDLQANVAYRDEFYRTARDIAALSQVYENVQAIDAYVVNIAANGENDKIINLLTDGYDHILETETEENILTVVERRNHQTTLAILKTVSTYEEIREQLHAAVRRGDKLQVAEMLRKCGKDASLMAVSKNEYCRCSLHIAILAQHKDIVTYMAKKFPKTLHTGDNLERTPLHYAMALQKVEEFSHILIRCGAKRTVKDLKGRQPTYYFMNKEEIIRMQREENYYIKNMENYPREKL